MSVRETMDGIPLLPRHAAPQPWLYYHRHHQLWARHRRLHRDRDRMEHETVSGCSFG